MNGEEKICYIIESICKKLGINYISKHVNYSNFKKDAIKLAEIYLKLKEIIADLVEIEEKYNINGLKQLLEDDIHKLDNIDHDLIKISKELRKCG